MAEAAAFWVVAPGRGELRREPLPEPGPGDLLVETLASGISRGTETSVFQGRVPDEPASASCARPIRRASSRSR